MQTWTNGRIHIEPWQAIPEQMDALGLTNDDGMKQVWSVDENGCLTGGAAAVNQALRACWWVRPFTFLYAIPGLRQLEDWVYRWVAQNRYRMPGSTAACAVERPSRPQDEPLP